MMIFNLSKKIFLFFKHTFGRFITHPLGKNNPIIPIFKFTKLKLLFFLGGKKLILPWVYKINFLFLHDDWTNSLNYYLGLGDFEEMSFMLNILEEKDVFLDIGANIGSYSILLSKLRKVKSISFEPIPETYNNLCINIFSNNLSSLVFPKMMALTSEEKLVKEKDLFFSSDEGCMNRFVDNSYLGKKIKIKSSTIDSEVRDLNVMCMKIDAEGSDFDVLRGGLETLKKKSLISVVIEEQSEEVNNFLIKNGFEAFNYYPQDKKITPLRKKVSNRIWIKKDKINIVKERLSSPRKYKINNIKF